MIDLLAEMLIRLDKQEQATEKLVSLTCEFWTYRNGRRTY